MARAQSGSVSLACSRCALEWRNAKIGKMAAS